MGRNVEQEGKDFFKNHANITDTTSTPSDIGAYRTAAEQISDDLAKAVTGMTAGERERFLDSIAKASESTAGEYAEFKEVNGKLHVYTRGFYARVNLGMTTDTNIEDLMQNRLREKGSHGWDGPSL